MVDSKLCSIDVSLVPIKLHFVLFYGAMGGVKPFMPLLAKSLGIHATAVGLVYTVLPFCVFFSKPIFGYLTDYFQNIKLIIFTLGSISAVAYFSVPFIPALHNYSWTEVQLECATNKQWLSVIPQEYDKICLQDALKEAMVCELYYSCGNNRTVTVIGNTTIDGTRNTNRSLLSSQLAPNSSIVLRFEPDTDSPCGCVTEDPSFIRCSRPDVNSCFSTDVISVYESYQFWVFTLLVVIGGTSALTVLFLSDAACYEVLGDCPEKYGRQRLWATVSSGSATLLAGFLNDIASKDLGRRDYTSGFYLMLAMVIVDLILLSKTKLKKAHFSTSICKNIGEIFSSCETVAFAVAVFIVGGLTGLILSYQFWYLQDLGATQTLLGLTIAMQCIGAEMPFFCVSGWFIKKLGYFYCLTAAFLAFALRLGMYSILQDPWLVLPIEVLHGFTFALFYVAMTGYASENAPPGAEATMMGILGGLYEGLGFATGSFLGGVGYDNLGGSSMFLIASATSLVCAPTFALIHIVLKRHFPKSEQLTINKADSKSYGASETKP